MAEWNILERVIQDRHTADFLQFIHAITDLHNDQQAIMEVAQLPKAEIDQRANPRLRDAVGILWITKNEHGGALVRGVYGCCKKRVR